MALIKTEDGKLGEHQVVVIASREELENKKKSLVAQLAEVESLISECERLDIKKEEPMQPEAVTESAEEII